jgi:hypothetical protein
LTYPTLSSSIPKRNRGKTPGWGFKRSSVDSGQGLADQEVQPALARSGAEPGEIIVADLCAEAVLCCVTRASVVEAAQQERSRSCVVDRVLREELTMRRAQPAATEQGHQP